MKIYNRTSRAQRVAGLLLARWETVTVEHPTADQLAALEALERSRTVNCIPSLLPKAQPKTWEPEVQIVPMVPRFPEQNNKKRGNR